MRLQRCTEQFETVILGLTVMVVWEWDLGVWEWDWP